MLGIPIVIGGGPRQAGLPTLDRIDNSKGYVKGNVRVVSYRANTLKGDASLAEMQAVLKYMAGEL